METARIRITAGILTLPISCPRRAETNLGARDIGPFRPPEVSLKIELQSKLDLARIVRRVARGSNLTESGRICKIRRARNRDHTVAAEPRCIEIGVVEDVDEL